MHASDFAGLLRRVTGSGQKSTKLHLRRRGARCAGRQKPFYISFEMFEAERVRRLLVPSCMHGGPPDPGILS